MSIFCAVRFLLCPVSIPKIHFRNSLFANPKPGMKNHYGKTQKIPFSIQCQTFLEFCEDSFLKCPIVTSTRYIRGSATAGSKPSMAKHEGKTQKMLE